MRVSRKVKNVSNTKTHYPILKVGSFQMGPDTDQQALILNDISVTRQKLEEENLRLRDELAEAKLIIRILKTKLLQEQGRNKQQKGVNKSVTSKDTTVKKGFTGDVLALLDRSLDQEDNRGASAKLTNKEAFRNPAGSGHRLFYPQSTSTTTATTSLPSHSSPSSPPRNSRSRARVRPCPPTPTTPTTATTTTSTITSTIGSNSVGGGDTNTDAIRQRLRQRHRHSYSKDPTARARSVPRDDQRGAPEQTSPVSRRRAASTQRRVRDISHSTAGRD